MLRAGKIFAAGIIGGLVAVSLVLLLGATQQRTTLPSFTSPPSNWGSLTETYLRTEFQRTVEMMGAHYVESGGLCTASCTGGPSHTIPATVATVGGDYVSQASTLRIYGVTSGRIYVFLHPDDASPATFDILAGTGSSCTFAARDTRLVFINCAAGSGRPVLLDVGTATRSRVLPLQYVDTNASQNITAVTDIREANPLRRAWINVRDPVIGARGDGVTDDTAGLQRAITMAAGGVVNCPPGQYNHTGLTIASAGTTFVGTGPGHPLLAQANEGQCRLHNTGTGVNVRIVSAANCSGTDSGGCPNHVRLENLKLTGVAGSTHAIEVVDGMFFRAKRLSVTSWGTGAAGILLNTLNNPGGNGTYWGTIADTDVQCVNTTSAEGLVVGVGSSANVHTLLSTNIRNCTTAIRQQVGYSLTMLGGEITGSTTGWSMPGPTAGTATLLGVRFEGNTDNYNVHALATTPLCIGCSLANGTGTGLMYFVGMSTPPGTLGSGLIHFLDQVRVSGTQSTSGSIRVQRGQDGVNANDRFGVNLGADDYTKAFQFAIEQLTAGVFNGTRPYTINNSGEVSTTGFHDFVERATPSAPGINTARLFAQDNGVGRTQLCARFNTGATQCFATEP